jgi:hypothetical protein
MQLTNYISVAQVFLFQGSKNFVNEITLQQNMTKGDYNSVNQPVIVSSTKHILHQNNIK